MNATSDPIPPGGLSLPSSPQSSQPSPLSALARRFLACNPFYLASAGVLLWGVNRLSLEPKLTGGESTQILINFTALFAYEILLVLTAILLARRAIWEDALVLVGLENLFVMIPFSLLSRAVQLNESIAQEMCLAAGVLACVKFWALKRFIPKLNLPGQLLGLGGAVLALNIAVALLLQNFAADRPALHGWLVLGWLIALPALFGCVAFLPHTRTTGKSLVQRTWLPYAMAGLWFIVTGFHLYGLGYVHDFPWRNALLAPTLLATAWVVALRSQSVGLLHSVPLRRLILCAPFAAPFLALAEPSIFSALNALNVLAYGLLWWRQRSAKPALVLAILSLTVAIAGIPEAWLARFRMERIEWVAGIAALSAMLPILRSRDPRLGLLGGLGCGVLVGLPVLHAELSLFWPAQAGLMFALIHSLRWADDRFVGAVSTRHLFGLLWVLASTVWIRQGDAHAAAGCLLAGSMVLVSYGLARAVTRHWPPGSVAVYSSAVACLSPGMDFSEKLREIPSAFLAILASVPLFIAGTILALSRHRWQRNDSPENGDATSSSTQ